MTSADTTFPKATVWLGRNWPKLVAAVFWLSVIAAYWIYAEIHDLSALQVIQQLANIFVSPLLGPLLFLLFFTFQPLVFFPSALMGVAAGTLYGPLWGFLYTSIGAVGAATVCYWTGYYFGRAVAPAEKVSRFQGYAGRLRENTFEATLIMHLIFLPYDLVNYFSGFLRVRWRSFIAATLLGSIPGMLTFVFFGASIEISEMGEPPAINWQTLAASAVMLTVSLTLSRLIKQRGR